MRRTGRGVLLTATAVVALVAGGAGTAYAAHFQNRALPGSTVGGVSVAGMTRAEVVESVRRQAEAATVKVSAGDTTRTERLADLGYTVDVDATVDSVFAANRTWSSYATSLIGSRPVDAVVRTDPQMVDAFVRELVKETNRTGRDAGVRLGSGGTSFEVVPAVVGQTVAVAPFRDVLAEAARGLTSTAAAVEFVDTDPTESNRAAATVAKQANALVSRSLKISDGSTTHSATAAEKASWVTVRGADGSLVRPTVDGKKVQSWVSEVAKSLRTEPRSGTRNVDAAGSVLQVVTPARDGRKVTNGGELGKAAAKALAAGRAFSGAFEYTTLPATWTERKLAPGAEKLAYPATVGEKWVDVDLTKHTMTAYVGADVVRGPISMVNGAPETPTIVGTFHVYHKVPMMTMRGANADGSDYETPDVPWVSFFVRGYALHGAYWRDSFGYAGSHGCINLPISESKWIYDFAPIGTPVVTHT